jgi:hypothetical protein
VDRAMIDRLEDKISTKKEFVQNTKEEMKEYIKEEKAITREKMLEEKNQEKEERGRIKALEDIEDLVRDGHVIDDQRIKIILDEFDENIRRKLSEF